MLLKRDVHSAVSVRYETAAVVTGTCIAVFFFCTEVGGGFIT